MALQMNAQNRDLTSISGCSNYLDSYESNEEKIEEMQELGRLEFDFGEDDEDIERLLKFNNISALIEKELEDVIQALDHCKDDVQTRDELLVFLRKTLKLIVVGKKYIAKTDNALKRKARRKQAKPKKPVKTTRARKSNGETNEKINN